jgi:hypothetical protein
MDRAARAASRARSLQAVSPPAIYRVPIPVRDRIHSSLVSISRASSLLLIRRAGTALPVAIIFIATIIPFDKICQSVILIIQTFEGPVNTLGINGIFPIILPIGINKI